MVSFCKCGIEA